MPFPPIRKISRDFQRVLNHPLNMENELDAMLLDAVIEGNRASVVKHLEKGANVNCRDHRDPDGRVFEITPLMHACGRGDISIAQVLLDFGADLNLEDLCHYGCDRQPNWMGANAVIYACCGGPAYYDRDLPKGDISMGLLEMLLDKGGEVNWTTGTNRSPLLVAIKRNSVEAIALLLRRGASSVSCTDPNSTALQQSIFYTDSKVVSWLLEAGWSPNEKYPLTKESPINFIASNPSEEESIAIARILLAAGADINSKGKSGCSALFSAVSRRKRHLVEFLISSGANPNAVSWEGLSCLDMARLRDEGALVLRLLNVGAKSADQL